jgi:diaminohydroxyphosphoribosylaminopyrimidine deaminase/5-amino-6-(5-phosphoribosylamino)uracil reductase
VTTTASRLAPTPPAALGPPPPAIADAFRQALASGEACAGATAPNPPVGCAVLDQSGQVLACAGHRQAGAAHAEAAAIQAVRATGLGARIHTFVVTLEPCNHHGLTPPCADAILATSAKEVWIGAADPNPRVPGGGAARLASAGINVGYIGDLPDASAADLIAEAQRLIGPFAKWSRTGRPWITVKQALTADGEMIPPPGRKTFTDAAALDFAHRLRRRADAIITGSGCVLSDDPRFTVRRVADHPGKRRKLAILDRRRRTPAAYVKAARARGFDVMIRDDLEALIDELGRMGVLEALVEAGPTLLGAILAAGLWDEHVTIHKSAQPLEPDTVQARLRRTD